MHMDNQISFTLGEEYTIKSFLISLDRILLFCTVMAYIPVNVKSQGFNIAYVTFIQLMYGP